MPLLAQQRERLLADCFTLHEVMCRRVAARLEGDVDFSGDIEFEHVPDLFRLQDLDSLEPDAYIDAFEQLLPLVRALPLYRVELPPGWYDWGADDPTTTDLGLWFQGAACRGVDLYHAGVPEWKLFMDEPPLLDLDLLPTRRLPREFNGKVELVDARGKVIRVLNEMVSGFHQRHDARLFRRLLDVRAEVADLVKRLLRLTRKVGNPSWSQARRAILDYNRSLKDRNIAWPWPDDEGVFEIPLPPDD